MRITSSATTQDRLAAGQVPALDKPVGAWPSCRPLTILRGRWNEKDFGSQWDRLLGRSARSPDLGYTSPREDSTMRTDLVPGSRLPDLELPDHRGRPVRLSALANGYPLIVSFYRGYW